MQHEELYETPFKNGDGKPYLKIKANESYAYAERLGVDSVAFALWDGRTKRLGLVNEYKPPIGQFLLTAFGGSLDKHGATLDQIVMEEVAEESGYILDTPRRIHYLERVFVSTQMNQFCYLYLVDVTYLQQGERNPQTKWEEDASVKWVDQKELLTCIHDWKAFTIYFLAATKGLLHV